MNDKEVIISLLNHLVTINKDRIIGYKEVIHDLTNKDRDKILLFENMVTQSEKYENELIAEIKHRGAEVTDKTSTAGIIYNTWMDIMYANAEEAKPDINEFCLELENTTQKAYEAALIKILSQKIETQIHDIIFQQKQGLKNSFDIIKKLK